MGQLKAKTMMQKVGFLDPDKKTPEHDKIQTWVYDNAQKVIDELGFLKDNPYKITHRVWEQKLMTETTQYQRVSSIVGFVDLAVFVTAEDTIWKTSHRYGCIHFEIKTTIPSLGELIRQLRFYQEYVHNDNSKLIAVVSPDDSHKKILNEQGFWFYKYQDEGKLF